MTSKNTDKVMKENLWYALMQGDMIYLLQKMNDNLIQMNKKEAVYNWNRFVTTICFDIEVQFLEKEIIIQKSSHWFHP